MYLNHRILCAALLSLSIFAIAAAQSSPSTTPSSPSRDLLLTKIDRAIADQQWGEADSLLVTAIAAEPEDALNPLLMSNLGMIRHYAGNDSLAIATLTEAHDAAPSSVTILANRARIYTATGRIPQAVNDYNTIEELDSTYADTFLYRGLIYLYNGDFAAAHSDLTKRERLSPDNEETLIALASFYTITENYESAVNYYSRLINADPTAEYYAGRAMCALRLDRLFDAAEDIAEGLALDPDYSELYLCRAILNKKRYCKEDARTDADTAITLGADPRRVNALLNQ